MERGTRPIENPDLLVAIIASAFTSRAALSITPDVGGTVKSAVEAWIEADRAWLAYREDLRKDAAPTVSIVNNFAREGPEAAAHSAIPDGT